MWGLASGGEVNFPFPQTHNPNLWQMRDSLPCPAKAYLSRGQDVLGLWVGESERPLLSHSPCCPPNTLWVAAWGRDGHWLAYPKKPQGGWPSTPRPPTSTRGGRRVRAEWKPAPAPPFSMPPDCYPRQREAAFAGWSREGPGVPGQGPGQQEVGNRQLKTHPRKAVSHVRWGSKPQQMLHSPIRLHLQTPIWS